MIEALGNIGDFVGGVGVVVTLLYLAIQIRQNSRTVRAASAQQTLGAMSQMLSAIGCSPQASRAFSLGQLDPDKLTDEELYQFAHLIAAYFRVIEQTFYQHRLGGLDEDLWNGQVVGQLSSFMRAPAVARWWAVRRALFHSDFRQFVDDLPSESRESAAGDVVAAIRGDKQADV